MNLSNCKYLCKNKIFKFETKFNWKILARRTNRAKFGIKNALFGKFWAEILKKSLSHVKSTPSKISNCKVSRKNKILKSRTKNVFLGCFRQYFWKTFVKFEINALEFVLLQNFGAKIKIPYICCQKCQIWIFCGWNVKIILSYLKSTPSNLSNCKISCKNKNV